ncbi:Uncharacterised protein [Corynebacterium minutissimum]|uniref:Uncharacterized protein n=1 Tax=Corynebacterium minutissimum TaxID=38301 RepID=A0A376CQJ2_9CORY|nr:Uncharacterised protein [Corynebacterium minutissimum]
MKGANGSSRKAHKTHMVDPAIWTDREIHANLGFSLACSVPV